MRNLLGERDPAVLAQKEYGRTAWRQRQLNADPSLVAHSYDAEHLRAIHRHLFQDVYEWAGEYRTQNMLKSGTMRGFADVYSGEIDRYLADAQRLVAQTDWGRLDREQFGVAAANVFAHVNQAHPFREGNGRSSKVFLEHVAQQSGFTLDYARVSPQVWNQASEFSRPDIGQYDVVPDSLVPVFRHIAVERTATATPGVDPAALAHSPLSASYPKTPSRSAPTGQQSPPRGTARPGRGYGTNGPGVGR
ncbi:Fic/DOC family protein [Glutamicibacter arilaitensis]|nr:Fic family protein [Glutamicibacter arilaitensis]